MDFNSTMEQADHRRAAWVWINSKRPRPLVADRAKLGIRSRNL